LVPFYATLGFVAASFVGYIAYRLILQAVNTRKIEWLTGKIVEEVEAERLDHTRYADAKRTFVYGL
jgi:hypothetical protein